MRKPKLMVLGYARHGKDTVCEILRDEFGFSFVSSSVFVLEKAILPTLNAMGYHYKSLDEAMKRREEVPGWRAIWFECIAAYNKEDPSRLGTELFQEYDIYCGIRRLEELVDLKHKRIFDWSIWVDATLRMPPEGAESNTLHPGLADFTVNNNTTIGDLSGRLRTLMKGIQPNA